MSQSERAAAPRRAEIGLWLSQGWDWFVQDLAIHLVIGLIAAILLSLGAFFLLAGPVFAGLALVSLNQARDGKARIEYFFNGFRYFVWSFLAVLLISVFAAVGLAFLIVPGLVVLTMYALTFHFIVDDEADFWRAMESSRQFVSNDYFGFTVFFLLLAGLNFLGLCFFGLGVIVSLPVSSLALTAAFLSESNLAEEVVEPTLPTKPIQID